MLGTIIALTLAALAGLCFIGFVMMLGNAVGNATDKLTRD